MRLAQLQPAIAGALREAAAVLRGAGSVTIACHVSPDGDALGSMIGLGLALSHRGVRVQASWGDQDVEVPKPYTFLAGTELVVAPDAVAGCDVFVAVDCASIERLGVLRPAFAAAPATVNVDHHVSNTMFAAHNVVDHDAPSSSEIVLHLLGELGAQVDAAIATNLYAGLVTDTGRFGYANATPRAHIAAAALVGCGVAVADVNETIYESLPYGYLRTLGAVLARCRLEDDPPMVVTWQTQQDLTDGGITYNETDNVIDVVRTSRETDVTVVLKELADGAWKVSLRSKGGTDVGGVATRLGGGGHTLAAGFTSEVGLEETVGRIRTALRTAGRAGG